MFGAEAAAPNRPGHTGFWRLSIYYLSFFAVLGVLMPYWPLYLHGSGYTPTAIGQLTALMMLAKLLAPTFWGWISDRYLDRLLVVRLLSTGAFLSFAGVLASLVTGAGFGALAAALLLFGFFWTGPLPQVEVVTLNRLGKQTQSYTYIRVWGSLGFIASVWLGGHFLIAGGNIGQIPWVIFALLLCMAAAGFLLPRAREPDAAVAAAQGSLRATLLQPRVITLLGACFLMQLSHSAYYTFYSIYLEELGYSNAHTGNLWALAVLAEAAVYLFMYHIFKTRNAHTLLLLSFLGTSLRWLLLGTFAQYLSVLLFCQLLHALSFGVYHAASILLIHHYFPAAQQGRGQALYSSLSFGAGLSVGNLLSGIAWEHLGGALTFQITALIPLLGCYLIYLGASGHEAPRTSHEPSTT